MKTFHFKGENGIFRQVGVGLCEYASPAEAPEPEAPEPAAAEWQQQW